MTDRIRTTDRASDPLDEASAPTAPSAPAARIEPKEDSKRLDEGRAGMKHEPKHPRMRIWVAGIAGAPP
jgi:hypothetical protein